MTPRDVEGDSESRIGKVYEYLLEVLLFVLVTPALLSSVSAVEWIRI